MSGDFIMTGIGVGLALGAIGFLGSLAISTNLKNKLFPAIKQTYLSDTLDFDCVDQDGCTLIGKTGHLTRSYEIKGKDHNICHQDDLLRLTKTRQFFWDRLAEAGMSLKIITMRQSVHQSFDGAFNQPVLQEIHNRWMTGFKKTYLNKHYLILEQQSNGAKKIDYISKARRYITGHKSTDNQAYKQADKDSSIDEHITINKSKLEETCLLIETTLSEYGIQLIRNSADNAIDQQNLGLDNHNKISPLLTMWARLINQQKIDCPIHRYHISECLVSTRITFDPHQGIITYFDGFKTSYASILTLNKWGEESSTLMMRELLALEGELTFLHLLKGYPKVTAMIKLEDKRRQQQLGFFSNKTQEELEAAKRLIEGDEASYWMYQFSTLIRADSIEDLEKLIKQVKQIFTSYGITAAKEMAALEHVWRSQLPGAETFLRPTYLLSHNLSYLLTFDQTSIGQNRSDWGPGPLRYMKTVSGESYRLNLHVNEQKEALGHNIVIAPSGSGKTTLIQHLIAGALRHPDLRVFIFDRFNGTRIFTQACEGTYIDFKGQEPVQLNPFLMPVTRSNQQTLRNLLILMAGQNPDHDEIDRILQLIQSLPTDQRILWDNVSALLNRHNPNYKNLKRWFTGVHSQWFNGARNNKAFDALDLKHNRLIGFEMTDIMNSPDIVAPLTYYLNQRIKDAVYDQENHISYPHWLFYDESAPMLTNPFIRDQMVKVDLQEARKRRGVVTLCFQSVQSLIDTGVSNIILDQCKTHFLFPNPNCKKETLQQYKNTFNLTDAETAFVSGEHPQAKRKPYSVLLKKPTESIILDCDLSSLGNYLKIYKSGTEYVAHVNQLQQQSNQQGSSWVKDYLSH